MTGIRPRSIRVSRGCPLSQCLHGEDIEFLPFFCTQVSSVGYSAKTRRFDIFLPDPSFRLQHDPIVTKLLIFLRAAGPNNQELHSSNPIYSSDLNVPLKAAYREVAFQC